MLSNNWKYCKKKEEEYVLYLEGVKIQRTTNGEMSNKEQEKLGEAKIMQENPKE